MWDLPGSTVIKTPHSQHRGPQDRSLTGELRSQMPHGTAEKKKEEIPKALVLTATSQHNSPFSNEIFSLHANCERLLYIKKKKKTLEINL